MLLTAKADPKETANRVQGNDFDDGVLLGSAVAGSQTALDSDWFCLGCKLARKKVGTRGTSET
jgi:hypothetical protein